MRGIEAAHFRLRGRNPREEVFRGRYAFLSFGGGPALLQKFDLAIDRANLAADLFLPRDAVVDAIQIERHHRIAAGAQLDCERIEQLQPFA